LPTNVHDQLATGKKLRVLTVVDTFSRYVPVPDVRYSYRGEDIVATLDRVCRTAGYPKTIRVDQGSEFVSLDMDLRAYQRGVILDFSRPGKPTENACILRRGNSPPDCFMIPPHLQWTLPGGVSEPALVPDTCGCGRKIGGLA